jgi:glycosyltransferase involved in cell wall biosynthesis
MQVGRSWPKLTIVTPSYNQGCFIEETIRSVLLQGYPNLEYIIMDGGSTDESVEIIRKYAPWLAYWHSMQDKGQADAINKGFTRSSGEIIAWVNSDDTYEPETFYRIVQSLLNHPSYQVIHGDAWYINESGQRIAKCSCIRSDFTYRYLLNRDPIVQPTCFWYKALWQKVGPLRVDLNWGFDWEWYIRAKKYTDFLFIYEHVANYRAELALISRRYGGWLQPTVLMYLASRPTYCLESTFANHKLPNFLSNLTLGAARILPRLMGRILKGYYQT